MAALSGRVIKVMATEGNKDGIAIKVVQMSIGNAVSLAEA